ncbi:MAG TPA: phosphotransferase [Patescibacteria group bacterium]|nr:phosphotransferase [Patescibacteria group bacterium]
MSTEHFATVQSSLEKYASSIDLEITEKNKIPFTGGEIIYARTQSGMDVVIKKTARKNQAEHEWRGLNTAHSTGIATPSPIALVNYNQDHLALVSTRIHGKSLYFNPNPGIKDKLGNQIRIMHNTAQVTGDSWKATGRNSFAYYDKYIFNWSRVGLEEINIDSKSYALIKSFRDLMEQFCNETQPTFNHNDLHDGQVIVTEENIPVLIDFGEWTEETWLNDIGYYLFHQIRTDRPKDDFSTFLNGYLSGERLSESERSNLAFYLLFISSRALTYFYRNSSPYLSTAKETHGKVLKYVDNEEVWKNY